MLNDTAEKGSGKRWRQSGGTNRKQERKSWGRGCFACSIGRRIFSECSIPFGFAGLRAARDIVTLCTKLLRTATKERSKNLPWKKLYIIFLFLEGKGEGKGRRWLRRRRRKYSLSLNRCQISVFDIRLIKFNCNYPNQWNLARSSISHARYIQLQ